MAKVLDWTFRLLDKMSGPASKIAGKLQTVNTGLKSSGKLAGSAADQQKHAAFRWNKGVEEMAAKQKEWNKQTKSNSSAFGQLAEDLGLANIAIGAAVGGYAALGALTVAGAGLAIDAAGFRENTVIALEALLGSQKAAEASYEKILDVADRVGLEKADAVASLKKLLSAGFDEAGALAVIEAVANTSAVLGSEAAGRLENFFTVMKSTGKFDLESLKKTGINVEAIYSRLAKTLGKSVTEVKALEKSGGLKAEDVTKAVTDEVNKGGIGEKLGNTFDRIWGDVIGKFERLFDKVDLSPLKNALKSILGTLDGPAGERLRAALNKIFGGLFDALFGAADGDRMSAIIGAIADALNVVGDVVVMAAPAVKAFIGGLIDGFSAAWPAIEIVAMAFFGLMRALTAIPGFWKMVGYAIAFVVVILAGFFALMTVVSGAFVGVFVGGIAAVIAAVGALISALEWLWELDFGDFFSGIGEAIAGFAAAAWEGGAAIISGLVGGIMAGVSAVISAIVSVASSAIDAAESALGIASPSKKFAKIGAFTSMGLAEGAENDNSGQEAISAMAEPPSATGARAGARAAARGASSGASGAGGASVSLHIDYVDARGAQPEDIEEGFAGVIEQVKLAVNG